MDKADDNEDSKVELINEVKRQCNFFNDFVTSRLSPVAVPKLYRLVPQQWQQQQQQQQQQQHPRQQELGNENAAPSQQAGARTLRSTAGGSMRVLNVANNFRSILNDGNASPSSPSLKDDDKVRKEEVDESIEEYRKIQHRSRRRLRRQQNATSAAAAACVRPVIQRPPAVQPRTKNASRGDIFHGYHDYIVDSDINWTLHMKSLTTRHQFDLEQAFEAKYFVVWKRLCWWRIVRVRCGRRYLVNWHLLTVNTRSVKASKDRAAAFFRGNAFKRAVEQWKVSIARRQLRKRKSMRLEADKKFFRMSTRTAIILWKKMWVEMAGARRGAEKLSKLYKTEFMYRPCFCALREFSQALLQKHGAEMSRALSLLGKNAFNRSRLREINIAAIDVGRERALIRGLRKLRASAASKKAFRLRLVAAFRGSKRSAYNKFFHRWEENVRKILDGRERLVERLADALEYKILRKYFGRLQRERIKTLAIIEATAMFNVFKAKNSLQKFKRLVNHNKAIREAQYRFNVYKGRRCIEKMRKLVLQRRSVRAFSEKRELLHNIRTKVKVMGCLERRVAVSRAAAKVESATSRTLAHRSFKKFHILHNVERVLRRRRKLMMIKVLVNW